MEGSGNGSRTYWLLGRRCRAPSVTPYGKLYAGPIASDFDRFLVWAVCAEYWAGKVTS